MVSTSAEMIAIHVQVIVRGVPIVATAQNARTDSLEHIVRTLVHQVAATVYVRKSLEAVVKGVLKAFILMEPSVNNVLMNVLHALAHLHVPNVRLGIGVQSVKILAQTHATDARLKDNV